MKPEDQLSLYSRHRVIAQRTRVLDMSISAQYITNMEEKTMEKPCDHLQDLTAADFPPPRTPGACEECLKEGTRWVELRECQTCGHVGCCDSSAGKHATKHFHETRHPVMRSATPGTTWTWCYVHQATGSLE